MANAVVGVLRAVLTADTVAFDDAMKRAADSAKEWADRMDKTGRAVSSAFGDAGAQVGESIGKLVAAFSISHVVDSAVSSLVEFGKSAFETAGQVVDLSQKLGMSTDAIQRYSYVAQQGGTTVESFGQAIFKLGINLEKGGAGVDSALKTLGLTSQQLAGLKPEDQFDRVARALSSLDDVQKRNTAGAALMGKGYSDIAAAIAEYNEKVGQASVVDESRIRALDEADKAWGRLKNTLSQGFTSVVGGVVLQMEKAHEAGTNWITVITGMTDGSTQMTAALKQQKDAQEALNKALADYGKKGAGFGKDINLGIETDKLPETRLDAAKKELDALSAYEKGQIANLLKLGESLDDVGKRYGLHADAIKLYASYTAEATKADSKHEAELKKAADAAKAYADEITKAGIAMSRGGLIEAQKKLSAELLIAAKNGGLSKDALDKYGKEIDDWLSQGFKVDSTLTDTHYQWVLMHAATDDAAKSLKFLLGVSKDLTPELEHQGAAAKALAENMGFFSKLAGDTKGNARALREITGPNAPGALDPKEIFKAPPPTVKQTLKAGFAAEIPNAIGGIAMGAISGGRAGVGQAAVGIAGGVGSMVGSTIGASVTKSLTKVGASAAGMGATIAGGVASMGISIGVQAAIAGVSAVVAHKKNATKKVREDFAAQMGFGDTAALYADLAKTSKAGEALANTGRNVIGKQDQAANEKWMADVQKFYSDIQKKQAETAQKIADDFGKLSTALENFGGVAPKSLHPMIEELLKAPGLTEEMRTALTGMTKDPSWETLQSHAEALGVSLSALGPAFQSAKITDTAQGYARDLQMFADAGADIPGVLQGMSDELSTLYQESKKNGVALPDTLKPYMEQLVRMGGLVDENGEKVSDLSAVAFKDIPDTALKDVVDVLKEIKDLLANQLPKAADSGAAAVAQAYADHPISIPVMYDDRGGLAGLGHHQPEIGLQGGTHGQFVDWGAGTDVTLHGREAVVREGEMLGAGGRPIEITVVSTLDGRAIAKNQVRYIPRELTLGGV